MVSDGGLHCAFPFYQNIRLWTCEYIWSQWKWIVRYLLIIFYLIKNVDFCCCIVSFLYIIKTTNHLIINYVFQDCRRFLNAYNASHGHYRLVYTFPCLSAFVGEMQLIKPKVSSVCELVLSLSCYWLSYLLFFIPVSFFVSMSLLLYFVLIFTI